MQRNEIIGSLARLFPVLVVIGVIGGLAFAFLINRQDFVIRGIGLAIPALLAAVLILLLNRSRANLLEASLSDRVNKRALTLIFTLLFLASVILLVVYSEKTWPYFLVSTGLSIVILWQILLTDQSYKIILTEIVLCLTENIVSVTLSKPLYYGFTDIIGHMYISKLTYLSGHTVPLDYSGSYANFPLYHILIAAGTMLSGIDTKLVLFILTAIVYVSVIPVIYFIVIKMINNNRVALLACLSFAFSYTGIFYGTYMVTRVMAFVGFVFILYFLYKQYNRKNDQPDIIETIHNRNLLLNALAILLALFTVLVHQVSILQICALLLLLILCEWALNNKRYIILKFFAVLSIIFTAYWIFQAYSFSRNLIEDKLLVDSISSGVSIKGSIQAFNALPFLIVNIDMFIVLFFALIGTIYVLSSDRKKSLASVCLFSLLVLVLYVPNPLLSIYQLMTVFRFDRFALLVSPFIALATGLGIFILYKYFNSVRVPMLAGIFVITLLFGSFALMSSGFENVVASSDQNSSRNYFNAAELDSFSFVENHVPNNSIIYSDYDTERYFGPEQNSSILRELQMPYYRSGTIRNTQLWNFKGFKIIRWGELTRSGLSLGPNEQQAFTRTTREEADNMTSYLQKEDVIFTNGEVNIYNKLR